MKTVKTTKNQEKKQQQRVRVQVQAVFEVGMMHL